MLRTIESESTPVHSSPVQSSPVQFTTLCPFLTSAALKHLLVASCQSPRWQLNDCQAEPNDRGPRWPKPATLHSEYDEYKSKLAQRSGASDCLRLALAKANCESQKRAKQEERGKKEKGGQKVEQMRKLDKSVMRLWPARAAAATAAFVVISSRTRIACAAPCEPDLGQRIGREARPGRLRLRLLSLLSNLESRLSGQTEAATDAAAVFIFDSGRRRDRAASAKLKPQPRNERKKAEIDEERQTNLQPIDPPR
ncbi:hypothetical protein V9T40_009855 [Parthenolecanium corni]|uniref:Uncharacterized protein n=1 Tax=Parthenolecanium corni TaxID=536013 RepID=A0AAN9TN12_9HEMI